MRITHPRPQLGRQRDLGVDFIDGVAHVESLHPERELALRQHGYGIEADTETEAPFQEALGEPIIDLNSLTVPQLRDIAEAEGIDLPAKARKDEIVEILAATSAPIPGATRNDDGSWTIEGQPVDEADAANGPFGIATTIDGTVIGDGKTIATLPLAEA
jgi:hypothetical protein